MVTMMMMMMMMMVVMMMMMVMMRMMMMIMMMMMMIMMMMMVIRMIMWMWDVWDTGNVAASFCSHTSQPTIATVPADETVEPKDLVLLLPLLIIPIKSSERKENRDWNLIPFAIALWRALVGSNVFGKFDVTSSNISGATITRSMHGFPPDLAWKTTGSSAKESCEHGELLHFGGVQSIPWWRKQTRLKAWAVPSPQSSPQL